MRFILMISVLIAGTVAGSISKTQENKWQDFKKNFNKVYASETEEAGRLKNFVENLKTIEDHNKQYNNGAVKYKLGLNQFSDMSHDEFVKTMNGARLPSNFKINKPPTSTPTVSDDIPDEIDWRQKGAVTEVKNQGSCGSCWAFTAVASLEGQHFIKKGVLPSLSEQNLLDCVYTHGCRGGWPNTAFDFIKREGGIDTEDSYPYTGKEGDCHFDKNAVGATDDGYQAVGFGDENKLKEAVAEHGPIAVAVDGGGLQHYHGGIYDDKICKNKPDSVTHGMVVVGYGTENGTDYWLIKNSYGTTWGENGYLRLIRNAGNRCAIATYGSYPIVN